MAEQKNVGMNVIEGFDPTACTVKETAGLTLEAQKLWFRKVHPNGRLVVRHLSLNAEVAVIEARVYPDANSADEGYLANAISFAARTKGDLTDTYIRTASNQAMAAALCDAGFGIQYQVEVPKSEAPKAKRFNKTAKAAPDEEKPVTEEAAPIEEAESTEETAAVPVEEPQVETEVSVVDEPAPQTEETPSAEQVTPITAAESGPTVEQLMEGMTLTNAIQTEVTFGAYKGKTLGQIVKEDASQIKWFRDGYKGPDNRVRAAAAYLLAQAGDTAAKAA